MNVRVDEPELPWEDSQDGLHQGTRQLKPTNQSLASFFSTSVTC